MKFTPPCGALYGYISGFVPRPPLRITLLMLNAFLTVQYKFQKKAALYKGQPCKLLLYCRGTGDLRSHTSYIVLDESLSLFGEKRLSPQETLYIVTADAAERFELFLFLNTL